MNERCLAVTVDGQTIAEGCRVELFGLSNLSLYPDLLSLRITNLSESSVNLLKQGKEISVYRGLSLVTGGDIQDVVQETVSDGVLTTVGFSFGTRFWEASVSLSLEAGMKASETIRHLLAASECGAQLLSFPEEDPVFARPQAFFGRLADAVDSVMSGVPGKACLVPGGVIVVPEHSENVDVEITEAEMVDEPEFLADRAVVRTLPTGWPMGRRARVRYRGREFTGVIAYHELYADTADRLFQSELMIEKELAA